MNPFSRRKTIAGDLDAHTPTGRRRSSIFKRFGSGEARPRGVYSATTDDSCESDTSSATEGPDTPREEEEDEEEYPPVEEKENIWEEVPLHQNIRLQSKGSNIHSVRCATLHKIVECLTTLDSSGSGFDQYQHIFFMTYRSFATPSQILELIIARFEGPPEGCGVEVTEDELRDIRKASCVALKFWFTNHFRDFTSDNEFMKRFMQWLREQAEYEKEHPRKDSLISYVNGMVTKKMSKGSYQSLFDSSVMVENPPPPRTPKSWRGVQFMVLDELEIARQLTIAEYHLYAELNPVELQDLAWSKAKLKHRAPNLLALIDRFNWLSGVFSTLILSMPTLKERKRVLEKTVKICQHLFEMNNFNAVMAIMSGMSASAVYRLKHTFASLNKESAKFLQFLNDSLSANQSYKSLRSLLTTISPPCIPFLGVYLTDLTFVEDGNPDKVLDMINFKKRILEYDIIVQVLKFQTHNYSFKLVPQFESLLRKLPIMEENDLYTLSLKCEPRKCKKKDIM